MDSKIVFVALVLIAAVALPYLRPFRTLEKDFITTEAVRAILQETNSNAINALTSKTLISSVVLDEALLKNLDNGRNGIPCGESCVFLPCFTKMIGCSCKSNVCYM